MEIEELIDKITPFLKRYWLPLLLASLGLMLFVSGLILLFREKNQLPKEFSQSGENQYSASKSAVLLTIDIEGAVVSPGVYRLAFGSIVQDALIAAKGLAREADREFVARNINLAEKLNDGQKIYIPQLNETDNASTISSIYLPRYAHWLVRFDLPGTSLIVPYRGKQGLFQTFLRKSIDSSDNNSEDR